MFAILRFFRGAHQLASREFYCAASRCPGAEQNRSRPFATKFATERSGTRPERNARRATGHLNSAHRSGGSRIAYGWSATVSNEFADRCVTTPPLGLAERRWQIRNSDPRRASPVPAIQERVGAGNRRSRK